VNYGNSCPAEFFERIGESSTEFPIKIKIKIELLQEVSHIRDSIRAFEDLDLSAEFHY